MPNRIIKESIWISPTLAKISFEAASHFLWLLPLPDDFGCCQLLASVIKGKIYPLRDSVTVQKIEKWHAELENVDLIRTWRQDEHVFAYFPTWGKHQYVRSRHQRKTPEPPADVINRQQMLASAAMNPNPNPNPNPNLIPKGTQSNSHLTHEVEDVFDSYCQSWGKNKNQYTLSASRRQMIQKALKSHGLEACLSAVKKFRNDSFEDRAKFNGLEYLFGNEKRIDKWCSDNNTLAKDDDDDFLNRVIEIRNKKLNQQKEF